jgi:hypothetical protein
MAKRTTDEAGSPTVDATRLAELLAVLAVVIYGLGWHFLNRFYGEFSVNPEEAGASWQWVIARTAVITLPPIVALAAAGAGTAALASLESRWTPWIGGAIGLVVILDLAALYLEFGVVISGMPLSGTLFVAGTFAAGALWVRYRRRRDLTRQVWVIAACVSLIGLLMLTNELAATFAARVRSQDTLFSFSPYPGGPAVLQVPQLRVDESTSPLHGRCVMFLGTSDGIDLLYVPRDGPKSDELWRVPAGTVTLVRFESGSCSVPGGYTNDEPR